MLRAMVRTSCLDKAYTEMDIFIVTIAGIGRRGWEGTPSVDAKSKRLSKPSAKHKHVPTHSR